MIIIPIGDVNKASRTPYVNYLLIGLNITAYIVFGFSSDYNEFVYKFGLIPSVPELHRFITSIFLHASIGHLLGNMLFLWITGDNVEDKLGHFLYLVVYLTCGVLASIVHNQTAGDALMKVPCIGASGAISGIIAIYAFLFPKSEIKIFYLFFIFIFFRSGIFYIASVWAVLLWISQQIILQMMGNPTSSVAYTAHIGGFFAGLFIIFGINSLGITKTKKSL